jgi:hypothetical protein
VTSPRGGVDNLSPDGFSGRSAVLVRESSSANSDCANKANAMIAINRCQAAVRLVRDMV